MNFWLKNGHIWPNIGFFGPFDPMPLKKEMWTSCPGGFSVMWVQKLLLPPVRIRIFGLKTAKFGPKLAFLIIWALLVGWLVVVAVSHKNPIYFTI